MYWLRRLLLLIPGRRRARARELDEELASNLSLAIADADDPREARRDFGSLAQAHEGARAVWFPGWDVLMQDLRFAARTLRRAPVFTVVAVLSLALGTGAATALFSLVNTVVLKPLAYRDPGQLMMVREVVPPLAHIYPTLPVNMQHFKFWREQARSFEELAAITSGHDTLSEGEPEVIGAGMATPNLFDLLGVRPQRGRLFQPADDQPSRDLPVVITDGLWRRRFGASESLVGQTIRMGFGRVTVAGILPATFRFPRSSDLGPLTTLAERTEIFLPLRNTRQGWGGDYDYIVFGRLRRGVAMAQALAELNLLEKRISDEHKLQSGIHVQIRPLQEVISSPVRASLAVLLSAVLVLVLIVCVNLANLLVARGSARAREYSLRIALGAVRGRLLMSALVETLLLAIMGGALGLIGARACLDAFVRTASIDLPRLDEVTVDGRVLAFGFALTLACGLLFGLLPALRLSRTDPQSVLRGASHTIGGSRQGLRLREWLVGGEVALSTLLLVLAGLLVASLGRVLAVDRGFSSWGTLDVSLRLPARYNPAKERGAFFDLAMERLRALPGVRSVAAVNKPPLTGESNVNHVALEGGGDVIDPRSRQLVMVNVRFISPDYFAAMGIPLMRGRAIEAADRDRDVAAISERLAAKLAPGQDPLGKVLSSGSGVKRATIVGVVGDVAANVERDPTPIIYVPYWRFPEQVGDLTVRASGDPRGLVEQVRRVIHAIDSGIPAPRIRTMDEIVDEGVARRRFQMRVAGAFALSALLLAALGIYGVVAYGVTLRRRELGIRMALGARAGEVRRLVLWQGLRPVALGLACGLAGAIAAGGVVRSLLFGVSATDGMTLGGVAAALGLVATVACLAPAHLAARIEPSRVLRDE
jgi:putative ABC transport system permease protein